MDFGWVLFVVLAAVLALFWKHGGGRSPDAPLERDLAVGPRAWPSAVRPSLAIETTAPPDTDLLRGRPGFALPTSAGSPTSDLWYRYLTPSLDPATTLDRVWMRSDRAITKT